MLIDTETSKCYQPLFNLLRDEYDIIATDSDMDEIIKTSLKVVEEINKLNAKVTN